MNLVVVLFCIYLLLKNTGSSYRGRVVTNPDVEDDESPIVND